VIAAHRALTTDGLSRAPDTTAKIKVNNEANERLSSNISSFFLAGGWLGYSLMEILECCADCAISCLSRASY
jgi:hypothetical protein